MTIGERIKNRRKELNLTQEELGKKMGVTKSAICKVERDKEQNLTTDRVEEFARALECSISYLMGWGIEKFNHTSRIGDVIKYCEETQTPLSDMMGNRNILPCDYNYDENTRVFEVLYNCDARNGAFDYEPEPEYPEYSDDVMEMIDLFCKATLEQQQAVLSLLRSFNNIS